MTVTIEALTKDLQASKAKVDQLGDQLEKEKTRGRALYEQFSAAQVEMQTAFGIEPSKIVRKRRERTPISALKSAGTSLLRKLKREGKSAVDAKAAVMATLLAEAKKELGLNALPAVVTQHVERQVTRRFAAPKK